MSARGSEQQHWSLLLHLKLILLIPIYEVAIDGITEITWFFCKINVAVIAKLCVIVKNCNAFINK